MNRIVTFLTQAMMAMLACAPSIGFPATGDVSFRAADKWINRDPGNLSTSIDVFFEIESSASVPATGWGMFVNITPQPGATGTIEFNPPTIANDEPNLLPASQAPFIDFDRDFGGKSYGMVGATTTQLYAISYYVEPTLGPSPSLDTNGNLTLPDGSGLLTLPLVLSADAAGDFLVTFDPDPVVTGVIFSTGMPAPDDIGVHPAGAHVAGVLSVVNPAGDYNRDGTVDAADYVVWRKTGINGPTGYDTWRTNFGESGGSGSVATANTTVPEPTTFVMFIVAAAGVSIRRRWRTWPVSKLNV
jgi:hypothetical protein